MDAPSLLVVVLGLAAGGTGAWLVVVAQRAALVSRELAAERAGRLRAERTVAAHRGSIVRLAEVARAGWVGESISVRGTVRVKRQR